LWLRSYHTCSSWQTVIRKMHFALACVQERYLNPLVAVVIVSMVDAMVA
jgi:hypothetical protein